MRDLLLCSLFISAFAFFSHASDRRAMTLEDIMGFHHINMGDVQISADGSWVAYSAAPDRGDGFGMVTDMDARTTFEIKRGERPVFSATGRWVLFNRRPPLARTEAACRSNTPNNDAVLIDLLDGSETVYEDVRYARFSESKDFLMVHHVFVEDTLLTSEQNEKLKEAGSTLVISDLPHNRVRELDFVHSFSLDSLANTLVYIRKDTVDDRSGLYCLSLDELSARPQVLDTLGTAKFGNFTWHGKSSLLAFMRAEDLEKDTAETAVLKLWDPGTTSLPNILLEQNDVPEGYFLPFDNRLEWTLDGERLYVGFRPERFAAQQKKEEGYDSELDSLRQQAAVDVWHGKDPLIKTHEKESWSRLSRQNLMSVYHLADGRLVPLACEEIHNLHTAPTGDHVLISSSRPYEKRITWEGWFRDVYVMDIYTGEKQLVAEEMQGITELSPDGRYVLYFLNKHWHAFNTDTGVSVNLTAGLDVPFYSETHDRPSTLPSYGVAGWLDDQQSVLVYDRYDVWLFNIATGQTRNVTGGWGRENQCVLRIRKLDDERLFGSRDEVFLEGFHQNTKVRAVYTLRLNREGVSLLKDTGQNIRLRRLSEDGNKIVFTNESQDVFPDLWIANNRLQDPVRLSDLHAQLDGFNWGSAELVGYHSADGVPLQGVVIKPGDYDPSKRYPVLVYFYEKFSQRLHEFNQTVINHRPGFGYYASNGYVVFLPDIHFAEGRPGMSAVKSLVPAVQKIIDMGIADPDAIGLHGHSWSGYQTAFVVTQTDIFKAAIAGAPVSNMTSAYGGIRWGSGLARQFQYETGQSRLGGSIFDKRYLYIENSPLFYAHEINTPMLIMHGDIDEAVPWEQSIELYLAMRRAGKEVIFLQYRDEPHHLQKYPNMIDYTIRMKEYFDHHLRGIKPAPWIIDGVPYSGN